jgi:hypothetical protein
MALTRSKFTKGEKVELDGMPATVVSVGGGKVTIRNAYGYRQSVKPSALKKLAAR